jgi:hypothetical protein
MNKLFTLITIALLIIVGYCFYTALDVFAASDNTVSICDTADNNSVAAYDGHNVDQLDANTRHCVDESKPVVEIKHVKKHDKKSHTSTATPTTLTHVNSDVQTHVNHNNPVSGTPVVNHAHCNNGNGNGAEGCNASTRGNQDETPVKGDKDVNHPTH